MAFLMCPPTYFDVDYVINPWMQGNLHQTSRELAVAQWTRLYDEVRCHAEVRLIEPRPALPDMVFTANAGLVHEGLVLVSHFRCPERRGEERFFREWFTSEGFAVEQGVRETPFEGEGDALALGNLLCLGYGFRTEAAAAGMLERAFECEVLPLRLVDPRFYHLDTCFAPLPNGDVMYYPAGLRRGGAAGDRGQVRGGAQDCRQPRGCASLRLQRGRDRRSADPEPGE